MTNNVSHSSLFRFIAPLLIVGIVMIGIDPISNLAGSNFTIFGNLPYVLYIVALLLCQSFNQGRMGMIAILMTLTYFVIQTRLQVPLNTGTTRLEYSLAAIILPVACMMVYLFPEKRIFSRTGLIYTLILALFVGWSVMTIQHFSDVGMDELWNGIFFIIPEISALPFVVILYCLVIVGLAIVLLLIYNRPLDFAIYTSILLATVTFVSFNTPFISSVLFSIAALTLIATIITTSHGLAFLDQLTGIPGRHALEAEMKHLGRKYSIAMLDVDHFKKFNDTYGHDTGDEVLRLVASKMAEVKGSGRVFRYGGEEFTVLFKRKDATNAIPFLDDLRESIANYPIGLRDKTSRPDNNKKGTQQRAKNSHNKNVQITVSIGVADYTHASNPHEVLKAADEALYKAKKGGRNRVSSA
jgi:diguanylate cyclase (GGDEF)-like protein